MKKLKKNLLVQAPTPEDSTAGAQCFDSQTLVNQIERPCELAIRVERQRLPAVPSLALPISSNCLKSSAQAVADGKVSMHLWSPSSGGKDMKMIVALVTVIVAVAYSNSAIASNWDESIDGDLSSDPSTPTGLAFDLGANVVTGSMSAPNDVRDYITFTIPADQQLSSIQLFEYVDLEQETAGNLGYHALNSGSTSLIPGAGNSSSFLGGDHLAALPSGTDLLAILGEAPLAGTGFEAPLGQGDYSYVIQQTGPELTGYSLSFVVSAVPEPGSASLFLLGAVSFAVMRRMGRRVEQRTRSLR